MKNKILLIALSILAVISLAACKGTSFGNLPTVRTVAVNGHGEVYVIPDVAYVNIGVQNTASTVTAVLNQNTDQAQGIRTALKNLAVEDVDIQTSGFSIYPMPQYDQNGKITETLYQASNTVFVTVRDLSKLGQILDAVVRNGANTVNSISFDVLNKTAALSEARAKAVADAKTQAQELADATGAKIGDVQYINVYSTSAPTPVYEGKGGGGGAMMSASVPMATGQLIISVDVSVTWALK
jgi:uncharacterized protein YggE